jgi:hypothetical protein
VVAAMVAAAGIGCQAGDSGGGATRTQSTTTAGEALPKASAVTVTYYYIPG